MEESVVREVYLEEVIIYKELIGKGTKGDPCRELTVVHKKDGSFIAQRDKWKELQEDK